jgi:hypothetical protein
MRLIIWSRGLENIDAVLILSEWKNGVVHSSEAKRPLPYDKQRKMISLFTSVLFGSFWGKTVACKDSDLNTNSMTSQYFLVYELIFVIQRYVRKNKTHTMWGSGFSVSVSVV